MQHADDIELMTEGLFVGLVAQPALRNLCTDPTADAREMQQGCLWRALFLADRKEFVRSEGAVCPYVDDAKIGDRQQKYCQ